MFLVARRNFSLKNEKNELLLLRLYGTIVCNCNVQSNNHSRTCGGCGMALLYDNPNLCHALVEVITMEEYDVRNACYII